MAVLLAALHRLVDAGALGGGGRAQPGGGAGRRLDHRPRARGRATDGGRVVGEGTPEAVARLRHAPPGGRWRRRSPAGATDGRPSRRAPRGDARAARPAAAPIRVLRRARAQPAGRRRWRSRATSWWRSPGSAARASRRWPSTCCTPRGSGASSTACPPTCASSCGRWRGPRWTGSRACRPRWPSSRSCRTARSMSTVGTASEVYHYLRLLFAFRGVGPLPAAAALRRRGRRRRAEQHRRRASPSTSRAGELLAAGAAGAQAQGRCTRTCMAAAAKRGVRRGARRRHAVTRPPRRRSWIATRSTTSRRWSTRVPARAARVGALRAAVRPGAGARRARACCVAARAGDGERFYSTARACPGCGAGLPVPDPRLFTFSQKFGACPECEGRGAPARRGRRRRAMTSGVRDGAPAPPAPGTRLRPEALAVRDRRPLTSARWPRSTCAQARGWLRDARRPAARRAARGACCPSWSGACACSRSSGSAT